MSKLNSLITVLVLALAPTAFVGCASTGDDMTDIDDADSTAAGKFDVWQATDGQWHFHLKSGNGAVLLTSEAYTSRTGAINGILSVLENGVDKLQYQVSPATHGYVLHLVAGNNAVISFSEVYATKSSATRAIASCVRAVGSYLDQVFSAGDRAHVEVNADADGSFAFSVVDAAGTVVLTSHKYASEASAWNGAFAIQAGALNAPSCQVAQQAEGFSFTATAENGSVVATSPCYATQAQADAALAAARALVPTIDIL